MYVFTHARLLTMDNQQVVEDGFLVITEGQIAALGSMTEFAAQPFASSPEAIVDVAGGWILPGFIDAHCHLGLFNDGLDFEGDDGNEDTDPITPGLRGLDGIYVDQCFREAYEAGVSMVMSGPGSANVMGGQFALIRTYAQTVDQALIQAPAAQKVAFGENPKRVYGKDSKTPATRMATAGILRDTLFRAREYAEKWLDYQALKLDYDQAVLDKSEEIPDKPDKPDFDSTLDALRLVVSGELPVKIHAHRQDDILTAIRICNEFGLCYTLDHCTEGYLIADLIYREYTAGQAQGRGTGNRDLPGGKLLGVIIGPIIGDRSKPELAKATLKTAGLLKKTGLPVAIMTDHPCVPQQYLALSAALCVKGGLSPMNALAAITSTAAQICGVSDRYGSLRVGNMGDVTVFSGDPFDYRTEVCLFLGQGKVYFDPKGMCTGKDS